MSPPRRRKRDVLAHWIGADTVPVSKREPVLWGVLAFLALNCPDGWERVAGLFAGIGAALLAVLRARVGV